MVQCEKQFTKNLYDQFINTSCSEYLNKCVHTSLIGLITIEDSKYFCLFHYKEKCPQITFMPEKHKPVTISLISFKEGQPAKFSTSKPAKSLKRSDNKYFYLMQDHDY